MPPSKLSKREQKDLRRLRREEAAFQARRKRFWLNVGVIGGAVLVAVVVLGLVALSIHNRGGGGPTTPSTSTGPAATGAATTTPSGAASGSAATVPTTAAATPTASGSPAH